MPARLTRGARRVGAHVQRKRASTLPVAPLVLKALKEARTQKKKKKMTKGPSVKGAQNLKTLSARNESCHFLSFV